MFGSWKINLGKYFGISVYLHLTFFLLPLLVLMQSQANDPLGYGPLFWQGLLFAVFGCVLLHEFGHALTARLFGIETKDITLYPIGGVARLDRMSDDPIQEFWIAVAGPAVNVVIAMLLLIVGVVAALIYGADVVVHAIWGQFLLQLLVVNLFLVLFNMIPAFPMDGGRVFRSLLSLWLGQLQATRIAANVGAVVALMLAIAGLFWFQSFMLVIVAGFVFFVGQRERLGVEFQHQRLRFAEYADVNPIFDKPEEPLDLRVPSSRESKEEPNSYFSPPHISVYTWDKEAGVWIKES